LGGREEEKGGEKFQKTKGEKSKEGKIGVCIREKRKKGGGKLPISVIEKRGVKKKVHFPHPRKFVVLEKKKKGGGFRFREKGDGFLEKKSSWAEEKKRRKRGGGYLLLNNNNEGGGGKTRSPREREKKKAPEPHSPSTPPPKKKKGGEERNHHDWREKEERNLPILQTWRKKKNVGLVGGEGEGRRTSNRCPATQVTVRKEKKKGGEKRKLLHIIEKRGKGRITSPMHQLKMQPNKKRRKKNSAQLWGKKGRDIPSLPKKRGKKKEKNSPPKL